MTKINRISSVAAVAAAAFFAPAASAQVEIYANVDNYLQAYTDLGNVAVADQVIFGGAERTLTGFTIEYFLGTGSSANAEVFLHLLDGPLVNGSPSPGSVIYQSGSLTLLDGGIGRIEETGLSLTVPNSIAYSVVFSGIDGTDEAGLIFYNPPTVGASQDDFFLKDGANWSLKDTPGLVDNFGAVFYAVPEPSTWALMLGGLGVLGFLSFRRKS